MTHPIIYATFEKPGESKDKVKDKVKIASSNLASNDDTVKIKKVSSIQSQKIRDFRQKYNMSQIVFAKAIELKHSIVVEYENGTANFNVLEWNKINNYIDKMNKNVVK
jgi:DNA-binding transcriptional regulator YiaG